MTWAPVGTNATNMPGMLAMAQVYEKYANDHGGFGGRKLKVLTCNERDDIVAVRDCAQQANDAGAVAVVGSYSEKGADFISALETYDIPYIGGYGITEDEFQSVESYPVNGGLPALLAGNGRQLADLCRKVTLVRPDTTTGDQYPFFLDAGLRAGGRSDARDLRTADDASQYTDVAEHAVGTNKTSDCVSAVLGDHTSTFFDSLRHVGDEELNVRVSSVLGSVTQSLVDSTGGAHSPLENAYVTGWYPPSSDPKWDGMKAAVTKYAFDDDRIDVDDPGAQTTWIAYTVLDKVVSAMGGGTAVTRSGLQRAMDRTSNLSTGGLTPNLGWTDADTHGIVGYSRLTNTKVTYQQVRDGRLVSARPGFVDLSATLSAQR
jgi:ABC-type branched-subunit amino acid transport system substrate-binding protein